MLLYISVPFVHLGGDGGIEFTKYKYYLDNTEIWTRGFADPWSVIFTGTQSVLAAILKMAAMQKPSH